MIASAISPAQKPSDRIHRATRFVRRGMVLCKTTRIGMRTMRQSKATSQYSTDLNMMLKTVGLTQ